jgi:hypothetical protein
MVGDSSPPVLKFGAVAIPVTGFLIVVVLRAMQAAPKGFQQLKEAFAPTPAAAVNLPAQPSASTSLRIAAAEASARAGGGAPTSPAPRSGHFAFISYRSSDARTVAGLEAFLTSKGVATWRDTRINVGDMWRHEVQHAIDTCSAVIVVMSGDEPSEEVMNEIEWAKYRKKTFLPVSLNGGRYYAFAGRQHAQLADGRVNDVFVEALRDQLAKG